MMTFLRQLISTELCPLMHTDLGYTSDRDGHSVAGVDFIALHIQSQSVQGNPEERQDMHILIGLICFNGMH